MLRIPLTENRTRTPAAFAGSAILHACIAVLIFNISFPAAIRQRQFHVMPLYVPDAPPPVPNRAAPQLKPAPKLMTPARIPDLPAHTPPPPALLPPPPVPTPRPEPSRLSAVALPLSPEPTRSPETVKVGGFGSASAAKAPAPSLQQATSASLFAAPVGTVKSPSDTLRIQIGHLEASSAPDRPSPGPRQVATAGFGAQTTAGATRPKGVRAATGAFGDPASSPPNTSSSSRRSATTTGAFSSTDTIDSKNSPKPLVAQSQFETAVPKPSASVAQAQSSARRSTPLEILNKPRPVYSEEARNLKLEGEVILEVLFPGSGQARVLRLIQGLGHGLDETAMQAALNVRFRPATQHGTPVDTVATIRIEFQLAF